MTGPNGTSEWQVGWMDPPTNVFPWRTVTGPKWWRTAEGVDHVDRFTEILLAPTSRTVTGPNGTSEWQGGWMVPRTNVFLWRTVTGPKWLRTAVELDPVDRFTRIL